MQVKEEMLKDEMLNSIPERGGNVAQFVSFAPSGTQRFMRIREKNTRRRFASIEKAVEALFATGVPYVNIRSFLPGKSDGNPFFFGRPNPKKSWPGLKTSSEIAGKIKELITQGFFVIANEEINVEDGGFSGVILGNVAEFATRDIPRCVEKEGCAVLPRLKMLEFARTIYSHRINIPYERSYRVEFSVHPSPVGYARQHQIIWQVEGMRPGSEIPEPKPYWPNRVSEDLGDKAYGLLMAHLYGFRVPHTRVETRLITPFEFGETTGSPYECWRRTVPRVQQPGRFTTKHGQIDPFRLMQEEDPEGKEIAGYLFQDDVDALYSGAAITDGKGGLMIDGKAGHGDEFMVGNAAPNQLPEHVADSVRNLWEKLCEIFGPVRFEWCYDISGTPWTVQLHVGKSASVGNIIYPGLPGHFESFDKNLGIEALRVLAAKAASDGFGIILKGDVGITSHFGDILRRAKVPSRLIRP